MIYKKLLLEIFDILNAPHPTRKSEHERGLKIAAWMESMKQMLNEQKEKKNEAVK
jgi:hypothetical protein